MKRIIAALFILLIGIGVLGYPALSNYLAEKNSSYAVDTYEKKFKSKIRNNYRTRMGEGRGLQCETITECYSGSFLRWTKTTLKMSITRY